MLVDPVAGEQAHEVVLGADRKKRDSPGSPWRPERPRSWLSMRRDSWRSVPTDEEAAGLDHDLVAVRLDARPRSSGSIVGEALLVVRVAGLQAELRELVLASGARRCRRA